MSSLSNTREHVKRTMKIVSDGHNSRTHIDVYVRTQAHTHNSNNEIENIPTSNYHAWKNLIYLLILYQNLSTT